MKFQGDKDSTILIKVFISLGTGPVYEVSQKVIWVVINRSVESGVGLLSFDITGNMSSVCKMSRKGDILRKHDPGRRSNISRMKNMMFMLFLI